MTAPRKPAALTDHNNIWQKGGIDLNSRNMPMEIDGQKIEMKFDPALIAQFKRNDFSGVHPVIINIFPIKSILELFFS